ncbi:unnamed protein product, partial [Iphiclides podalirius]
MVKLSRLEKNTKNAMHKCLVSLAKNNRSKRVCKLSSSCYTVLVNGTNFGYSLTHRLLILLQAHRGRGCTIFSTREDKELLGLFCLKIFREANFIANNGYKMLDLMLEQMTLCSLAGYADTLRRSWFMEVLKHQTSVGCFSPRLPLATIFYQNANLSSWNFSPKSPNMLGGACDRHFTAVAVGALSGAYIKSLTLILNFALEQPNEVDVDFAFVLSIAYDNLNHVLVKKVHKLPEELRVYIRTFLDIDSKLLQYFWSMMSKGEGKVLILNRKVSTLFMNRTLGVRAISEFNKKRKSPLSKYRDIYRQWRKYEIKVKQLSRWRPNPTESDKCLRAVARNSIGKQVCAISNMCTEMLINGTNFGYALTRRLLWLIQARRGRGCYLLSETEDKELIDLFCTKMFYEAHYIASNKFVLFDLLLEQITLCSLAGYADILRRSWILEMLKHQTPFGCFSLTLPAPKEMPYNYEERQKPWRFYASGTSMLGGVCSRQLTLVATGAVSSALRYVLEEKSFME